MAESNFDKNFNLHKASFQQKFGVEWNAKPELYIQYLQTIYISSLTEIANAGLAQVLSKQENMLNVVRELSKKIK